MNAGFRVSIYSVVKDSGLSLYFHGIDRMFGEPRRIWKAKSTRLLLRTRFLSRMFRTTFLINRKPFDVISVNGANFVDIIYRFHAFTESILFFLICKENPVMQNPWVGMVLSWCYTRRFATTILSASHCSNVGTMLQLFETVSQQRCNAALLVCSCLV